MDYIFIETGKQGHVFYLTLNRAQKRNAFTPTMVNEIAHAIDDANTDDAIKVVVLRALGPVFCAGMDLKSFNGEQIDTHNPNIHNKNISVGEVFDGLLKPSVAVVEGDVIAGGFLLILGCSYVFAKKSTKFRLPELSLGLFPFQVMASLLKVMPEKKVLQLCLETAYFNAEKALQLGLIDAYLEDKDLSRFVDSFAAAETKVLKAGIHALRELSTIAKAEQFDYLKGVLDRLKSS